jgi:N-acetylglucosaminyldiphosphoundecaprenol N-acetyl-beta-D-mannosaminyltransferase
MTQVELMGVGFDAVTEEGTVAAVMQALDAGRGGMIVTLHVEGLRVVAGDERLRAIAREAELVVADGMPLVWAAALQRTPLPERVAGSNLIWSLSAAAAERGRSIYLLGGEPGTAEAAAAVLRARYTGLRVAGVLSPPFGYERDPAEVSRITAAVREAKPDLVFVGLGMPKQELLAAQLRRELPGTWFSMAGISIAFVAGEVARAPGWMQRAGLEWLHRLVQEPRRLARRYLVDGLPFAARLLARSLRARRTTSG